MTAFFLFISSWWCWESNPELHLLGKSSTTELPHPRPHGCLAWMFSCACRALLWECASAWGVNLPTQERALDAVSRKAGLLGLAWGALWAAGLRPQSGVLGGVRCWGVVVWLASIRVLPYFGSPFLPPWLRQLVWIRLVWVQGRVLCTSPLPWVVGKGQVEGGKGAEGEAAVE